MNRFSYLLGIIVVFGLYNTSEAGGARKYPGKRETIQLLCDEHVDRCDWNNWESWSKCQGQCESGTRYRLRGLCCEMGQNFTECALSCNFILNEAANNASVSESCIVCKNGGVYDSKLKQCHCPKEYNGTCCDNVCKDTRGDCFNYDDDKCVGVYAQWAKINCAFRCGYCPESPPCSDKLDYCPLFKKDDCTNPNYIGYMRTNCRKYCDLCTTPNITTDQLGESNVVPAPETSGQTPHMIGDCYDKLPNDQCFNYHDDNCYGKYAPWAKENCRLRCGFCENMQPPCVDQIPNCNVYSKRDCIEFDKWGRYTCRKFCDRCVPPTQSFHFTTPKEDCVDKLSNCTSYDEQSCVGIFESWGRQNCPSRCGFCTGNAVNCVDYVRNCNTLPDVCNTSSYHNFAKTNCRKYCNLC